MAKKTKKTDDKHPLFDAYVEGCNFPGVLDKPTVERELYAYLEALGVERKVVQLERGWTLEQHPEISRSVDELTAEIIEKLKAAGEDTTIEPVSPEERAAARKYLAEWALYGRGYYWSGWELSWIVTTAFGAKPGSPEERWSEPLLRAFLAGAWLLYWTEDTLLWIRKPEVRVDEARRSHCEDGPVLVCDIADLWMLEGQLVTEQIVMHPETMTVAQIQAETNAEVRRIMRQRYGEGRYLMDSNAELLDADYEGARQGAAPRALLRSDGETTLVGTDGSTDRTYYMPNVQGTDPKTCREAHEMLCGFDESRIVAKS